MREFVPDSVTVYFYRNSIEKCRFVWFNPCASDVTCFPHLVTKCKAHEWRTKCGQSLKSTHAFHRALELDRFTVCEMYCLPLLQGHDSPAQDVQALSGSRCIYKQAKQNLSHAQSSIRILITSFPTTLQNLCSLFCSIIYCINGFISSSLNQKD